MRKFKRMLGRKLGPAVLVAVAAVGAVLTAGTAVVTSHGTCTFDGWDFSCDIGDLKSGESATVEIVVQPEVAGILRNTATVSGDQFDAVVENNIDTEDTRVIDPEEEVPQVDLVVKKSDSVDPAFIGETFEYMIEVANQGTTMATNVMLADELPLSVDFVSAAGGDCTASGTGVNCNLGDIAAGESKTVSITVDPTSVGSVFNRACAMSDQPEMDRSNDCDEETTEVKVREVDLQVVKSDDKDPVKVGEDLTYTVTITNNGPDDATGVVLTDSITQPSD